LFRVSAGAQSTGGAAIKRRLGMKKLVVLVAIVSVLGALFAGVALAKTVVGNDRDNTLVGTNSADTIKGKGGEDDIYGLRGQDGLYGGAGDDDIEAGRGNDFVGAVDRMEDDVECGRGNDRVRANPGDDVEGCEKVVRGGPRVGDRDD
jgi:Ca2+-binding RTX toxin-like protein